MKNIFAFLTIALFLSSRAYGEVLPTNDNYLMVTSPQDSASGSFIFQKTKTVFYGCDIVKRNCDGYKADAKRIKQLFDYAAKINIASIKSIDINKIDSASLSNYRIIEYKKDGKTYRVCWNEDATDQDSKNLNKLLGMMNSFW